MWPRVTEQDRLKHKVLISLNDDQHSMLLDEARARNLAPSIIARLAVAEGLRGICRKGRTESVKTDGCKGRADRDGI